MPTRPKLSEPDPEALIRIGNAGVIRRSTYSFRGGCGSYRARRWSTVEELSISIDALAPKFEPKGICGEQQEL